jgi:glycosyltransferase involved in cell wall biosynthesis
MRTQEGREQSVPRATVTGITTAGLLKGTLINAHKRQIPVEAWIRDVNIGKTTVTNHKPSEDKGNNSIEFELSINSQNIPLDWMIVANSPIVLRRTGKRKSLDKKGWWPGKKEAEAFRNYGLRRMLREGRLKELPEIAAKAGEPGILRDALLEIMGMALDTFMATGDTTINDCVRLALECCSMEEGLNSLVIERNAYLCAIYAGLTGGPFRDGWARNFTNRPGSLLHQERIRECLVESMPTPHLDCERNLWQKRVELLTGAACYRLYTSIVENSDTFNWRQGNQNEREIEPKGHTSQLLVALGDYIYTWHSKSNLGFLFYQLTGLLEQEPTGDKASTERELEEVQRNCANYCYEQAAFQAARLSLLRGTNQRISESLEYTRALRTIELALSGHDYANKFEVFSKIAKEQISGCWLVPYGTLSRKAIRNELYQYSNRVRRLANSLANTHCPINSARVFEEQCLTVLSELTELFYTSTAKRCNTRSNSEPRRWLIVGSRDLPQCWIYRVRQKKEHLERLGHQVRILGNRIAWDHTTSWTKHLLWADTIIVCRSPYTFPIAQLYALARSLGRRIYYEVDDVIFSRANFPPPLETYGHTITETEHRTLAISVELYRKCIDLSDGCIVSTKALKNQIINEGIKGSDSVFILPNLMLPELRTVHQKLAKQFDKKDPDEAIRIVFASGTLAHKQCWNEEMAPALSDVMKRHGQVQLLVLGSVSVPSVLRAFGKRIIQVPFQDYARYLEDISTGDIGLSVLEDNIATDCKSAIKWMEYSACGLASVVSPSDTHTRLLLHGVNVLFARGRQEWVNQIEYLISQSSSRREIAKRAMQLAIELFGKSEGEENYRSLAKWVKCTSRINEVIISQGLPKKRLLLTNVFFRPESHGGATRVAEQQALSVASEVSERFDVTVLCQDPCQDHRDRLSIICHHINGVRVVRIALPHLNWGTHWHEKLSRPLSRTLSDWYGTEGFDLIHAHCLQVLTIAPLVAARMAKIPYIVSLHDAWWLSPFQFLTTDDGRLIDPKTPTSHLGRHSSRTEAKRAHARRSELMTILCSAEARLAVSSVFQKLYQEAGLEDVGVLVNRHTSMARIAGVSRQTNTRTNVRACFIGGVSAHKGYFVLREALMRSKIRKLEIDIVDHLIAPGSNKVRSVQWGTVPVRFIPKIEMSNMADFYADYDVLLAPSVWPESYGLVTREALSAGLWVVASDTGALGEDIEDGVNGYRVPPADWMSLEEKIAKSIDLLLSPSFREWREKREIQLLDNNRVGEATATNVNESYFRLLEKYCRT